MKSELNTDYPARLKFKTRQMSVFCKGMDLPQGESVTIGATLTSFPIYFLDLLVFKKFMLKGFCLPLFSSKHCIFTNIPQNTCNIEQPLIAKIISYVLQPLKINYAAPDLAAYWLDCYNFPISHLIT